MRVRSFAEKVAAPPRHVLPELRETRAEVRREPGAVHTRLIFMQEALGRIEARQNPAAGFTSLRDSEFRVLSQWGEDGISRPSSAASPVWMRGSFAEPHAAGPGRTRPAEQEMEIVWKLGLPLVDVGTRGDHS